jgi:hypothetical protein
MSGLSKSLGRSPMLEYEAVKILIDQRIMRFIFFHINNLKFRYYKREIVGRDVVDVVLQDIYKCRRRRKIKGKTNISIF